MAALPRLELTCFGPPTARLGGRPAPPEVLWRKHLGLLVYLALAPDRRCARESLVGLLWAEKSQERARQNLNESLRKLRRCLGEERLRSEGLLVVLEGEGLDVDAARFDANVRAAPDVAVQLFRGPFLDGFHVDDATEFEDWMSARRLHFDRQAVSAFTGAAQRELAERRLADALLHGRRALELQPHSEVAITVVMHALFHQGDATAALAAFRDFADRFEHDTKEKTGKALTELAERIRKHAPPPTTAAGPREAPLVGRTALHRETLDMLTAGLAGGPRTIAITGAPGMGRTRLLAECRNTARAGGALFAAARPLASDHDARWSTLRQLFRAGLADAPGLPAARADALGTLAGIVPELAGRFAAREASDVAESANALAAVLTAIAEEKPLLIAIDDAHWADGPSLAVLHAALGQVDGARLVLVLTVGTGVGLPPPELQQLLAAISRTLAGAVVRLDGLTDADIGSLVAQTAPWCKDDGQRARLTRRISYEGKGNPLYTVTLLGALEKASTLRQDFIDRAWPLKDRTLEDPLPFSVPDVVKLAIEMRVAELSQRELSVLTVASLAGPSLDLALIAAVTEQSPEDVAMSLPALERRHLVAFDGARYRFVAPLVAEVVRSQCLTRGQRHELERKVAAALSDRDDLESRLLRCELLARVAPDAASLALALAVAREALASGGTRLARSALEAGERIATTARLDRGELDALRGRC
jgi:DNA-binding SARP family transcriptional activator